MPEAAESKNIGDPCPKCSTALIRRAGGFYWRGRTGDAAYCAPCNSIWQIAGEEVLGWDLQKLKDDPNA